jgi:hypothetical protein
MRTPGYVIGSTNAQNIEASYQAGGFAQQAASQTLSALGFNASEMYENRPGKRLQGPPQNGVYPAGPEVSYYSQLEQEFANLEAAGKFGEGQKAQYLQGKEFAGQIQGFQRIPGVGARGGQDIDWDKAFGFINKLGEIVNTPAGSSFQSAMAAWDTASLSGMKVAMPDIMSYSKDMTPEQAFQSQLQSQALTQAGNYRNQLALNTSAQSYKYGNIETGNKIIEQMQGMTTGQ